ncbi:hypothetical protein BGZ49_000791 [Haplosporangium sp. Z 27]|nr:hypothetical protein BGZ49_000791 [Haplosporangium sp. Z 27]
MFSKERSLIWWGFAIIGLFGAQNLNCADAHMSMIYPLPRGHPFNPNTGVVDYNCRDAPLYDKDCHKTFPCGGYPPDKRVVQSFQAGQVINVRFGNAQFGSEGQPPLTKDSNQARHAGGLCEFSLSYDQGRTFGVFARYHGSCPDMFYDWPIKLPDNLPSCESCLLGWSWINAAATQPEYYMSCADIKIVGKQSGPLPPEIANTQLQLANMPGYPYYHVSGDQFGNTKSNGPSSKQIQDNMNGRTGGPYKAQPLRKRTRRLGF